MYQASAESCGESRFIVTTRHASFVTDTQGRGANPVDTLLASLCSCMGHYVRDHLAARGTPSPAFRVSAASDAAREEPRLSAIAVRIDVGPLRLTPPERAALLAEVERCKIYRTLRQACRIEVAVVDGEAQAQAQPPRGGGAEADGRERTGITAAEQEQRS